MQHFPKGCTYVTVNIIKVNLCKYRHNPDVVFLQVLVPPYVQFLKEQLVNYLMIEGTVCQIDTGRVKLKGLSAHEVIKEKGHTRKHG